MRRRGQTARSDGTLEGFQQGLRVGNRRKAGMAKANAGPYFRSGRRRDIEQHFCQCLRKPPWNEPVGSDPQDRLVDAEAGDGHSLKARSLRA